MKSTLPLILYTWDKLIMRRSSVGRPLSENLFKPNSEKGFTKLSKGPAIIYGRGGGGANPKIVCTQNAPPLGARELPFCPPSDPAH